MALETSVVLTVLPAEDWPETPRASAFAAKLPPPWTDSAAKESEVTVPGFSFLGSLRVRGSVVT